MIALLIPDGTLLRAYVHRPRRGPVALRTSWRGALHAA